MSTYLFYTVGEVEIGFGYTYSFHGEVKDGKAMGEGIAENSNVAFRSIVVS